MGNRHGVAPVWIFGTVLGRGPSIPELALQSRPVYVDTTAVCVATNVQATPHKSGNNAHGHKSLGRHGKNDTTELADDGKTAVPPNSDPAHIGLKNPADFPSVSGRPHGS